MQGCGQARGSGTDDNDIKLELFAHIDLRLGGSMQYSEILHNSKARFRQNFL
jgi:hypothetical protein